MCPGQSSSREMLAIITEDDVVEITAGGSDWTPLPPLPLPAPLHFSWSPAGATAPALPDGGRGSREPFLSSCVLSALGCSSGGVGNSSQGFGVALSFVQVGEGLWAAVIKSCRPSAL